MRKLAVISRNIWWPCPGVHALACVVAFKLECVPDDFLTDPEGLAIVKVGTSPVEDLCGLVVKATVV
jgi:hypothetical protein